jgi:hypothetical protein
MHRLGLLLAVFLAASLVGCQREQPAPPKPGDANPGATKPFLVTTNAGIDHEFYRDISLEDFLKMLPTGSVDSVNIDFSKGLQVFALVKVLKLPGKDLSKIRFETTFKTKDSQVIEKQWTGAQDRKSGKSMALFCVPPSVVEGETKVVSIGE